MRAHALRCNRTGPRNNIRFMGTQFPRSQAEANRDRDSPQPSSPLTHAFISILFPHAPSRLHFEASSLRAVFTSRRLHKPSSLRGVFTSRLHCEASSQAVFTARRLHKPSSLRGGMPTPAPSTSIGLSCVGPSQQPPCPQGGRSRRALHHCRGSCGRGYGCGCGCGCGGGGGGGCGGGGGGGRGGG